MVVMAAGIAVGAASVAWAGYGESKSGTSYCRPEFTELTSRSQGVVTHEWPISTPRVSWFDPMYRTHRSHTGRHDTSWRVGVEFDFPGDDLIRSLTYSYCVPYG